MPNKHGEYVETTGKMSMNRNMIVAMIPVLAKKKKKEPRDNIPFFLIPLGEAVARRPKATRP